MGEGEKEGKITTALKFTISITVGWVSAWQRFCHFRNMKALTSLWRFGQKKPWKEKGKELGLICLESLGSEDW